MSAKLQHLQTLLHHEYDAFIAALSHTPPVSVRLNPAKPTTQPIFDNAMPVDWCKQGFYLPQRPLFTLDPLLHAGAYYVQEASSMFIEQALCQSVEVTQPLSVLDLCAAPGGKSTLIASLLTADSCLLANEIVRGRAHILSENLAKWGSPNVAVSCNDPAHFAPLAGSFDVVLCDAPCSGEGMFRKNPSAIAEWSLGAVQLCATRQQRILANAADLVREGGVLIYSTCTFNSTENEAQMAWLLQHPNFDYTAQRLDIPPNWNIVESNQLLPNGKTLYGYRFYPHRIQGEGLFVACLRRHDTTSNGTRRRPKSLPDKMQTVSKKQKVSLMTWLIEPNSFEYLQYNDDIYALPNTLFDKWCAWASSSLYWLNIGIKMGKLNGTELIPATELALSTALSPHIATLHLDHIQAINYLRKDELIVPTYDTAAKGWVAVAYEGHRLGWAKWVQGRINNHYPKEWRIRMANPQNLSG